MLIRAVPPSARGYGEVLRASLPGAATLCVAQLLHILRHAQKLQLVITK